MFHYKDRSRKLNWCMWNIIILCHIMTLCRLMTLSRIMTRLRRNLPENFRLSPLQSVLNATIHLTASLPHFSHISTFLPKHLNWILLMVSIHFKSLFITYGAFLFPAHTIFWLNLKRFCSQPTQSFVFIRCHPSAVSSSSLCSLDQHDLLGTWTATAQHHPYASVSS